MGKEAARSPCFWRSRTGAYFTDCSSAICSWRMSIEFTYWPATGFTGCHSCSVWACTSSCMGATTPAATNRVRPERLLRPAGFGFHQPGGLHSLRLKLLQTAGSSLTDFMRQVVRRLVAVFACYHILSGSLRRSGGRFFTPSPPGLPVRWVAAGAAQWPDYEAIDIEQSEARTLAVHVVSAATPYHETTEAMRWGRRLVACGVAEPLDIAVAAAVLIGAEWRLALLQSRLRGLSMPTSAMGSQGSIRRVPSGKGQSSSGVQ